MWNLIVRKNRGQNKRNFVKLTEKEHNKLDKKK